MDEQSILNFLQTLETDETLPQNQKLKLIKSALNVTTSTASQAGGDSSTASILLKQALDKFALELGDLKGRSLGKQGKLKIGSSSKMVTNSFGDGRPKTLMKMDAGCSPRESLLNKGRVPTFLVEWKMSTHVFT